jgi:hypothetical protein
VAIGGGKAVANISDAVFWISLVGLFVLTLWGFLRNRNIARSLLLIAILSAAGAGYYALFQTGSQIRPKGDQPNQWAFIVVLYVCMLLGMASNYAYGRFATTRSTRPPFDAGNFVAPILVSPIVFIPLLGAFQNAYVDLANLTVPKLMIFLVTFENGFFGKEFFDNRQREQRH